MKDIEKIKSEDLAAQVQDANPGNFAIEQEVAQLVGATVPQPTQPSADDARELGAQLLVFLRRALLPIRSALRTAVAAIYAHLDSRCTDYTPAAYAPYQPLPSYDPMGTPPTPRTLPNLLTALTAFSDRKIGGVPVNQVADGEPLVRLLGSDYAAVTKLEDNTKGWTCRGDLINTLLSIFTNLNEVTLGLSAITARISANTSRTLKITLTDCSQLRDDSNIGSFNEGCPNFDVHIYGLKTTNFTGNNRQPLNVGRYSLYDYEKGVFRNGGHGQWTNYATTYIYLGCKGAKTDLIRFWNNDANATTTDIEIRDGACQSLTFQNFTGLTAENMYNHILCRLKQDEPNCGSGVTITLGTTNIEKLEAVEEYNTKLTELEDTYGYTFA